MKINASELDLSLDAFVAIYSVHMIKYLIRKNRLLSAMNAIARHLNSSLDALKNQDYGTCLAERDLMFTNGDHLANANILMKSTKLQNLTNAKSVDVLHLRVILLALDVIKSLKNMKHCMKLKKKEICKKKQLDQYTCHQPQLLISKGKQ